MKEKFYELINEASTGTVIIDGDEWPVYFDTKIEQNGKVLIDTGANAPGKLLIRNEEKFFSLLQEYLELEISKNRKAYTFINKSVEEKMKFLMMNLISNATSEDFINPEEFLRRNIDFQKDITFQSINTPLEVKLGQTFKNSHLEIQNELTDSRMETPYKITEKLKGVINNQEVEYYLPSIYYGIRQENNELVCYIYSIILDNKKKNETEENKKYTSIINRLLYKLNNGIKEKESVEYFDFKNNLSDYYPEGNITDVTPSFILSLNIFITLLQNKNVTKIKAVPYLPIRYISREVAAENNKDEDKKKELLERNDAIQTNLTNKFIRTFRRLAVQNDSLEIETYPYELDEFLTIKLNGRKKELDNMLLEETGKKVSEEKVL